VISGRFAQAAVRFVVGGDKADVFDRATADIAVQEEFSERHAHSRSADPMCFLRMGTACACTSSANSLGLITATMAMERACACCGRIGVAVLDASQRVGRPFFAWTVIGFAIASPSGSNESRCGHESISSRVDDYSLKGIASSSATVTRFRPSSLLR
jgi:hypothetical protein